MSDLRYEAPASVKDVVALMAGASGPARFLAGGTDVLVQMHADMVEPQLLVDIKKIPELRKITREAGGFRVGAAVSGMELVADKAFGAMFPGVVDGVKLIGSVQVKGRATLAGNLCNASPAADSVPPMIAVGAIASIAGPNGVREARIEEITTGPGRTSLAKGELITSIFFPDPPKGSSSAYQRFTPRTEMDIAVVSVAVALTLDASGTCTAARMALGAVAEKALLVDASVLVGTKVDDAALDALAKAASAACRPIDDKRGTKVFRTEVAGVLAKRVGALAHQRAGGK